jgi:hypothetical protein
LERHAAVVLEATAALRRQAAESLESRTRVETDRATFEVYLGVAPQEQRFELALHKGQQMLLGYRTTASDCAAYLDGEPAIRTYASAGLIPVPQFTLERKPNGRFNLNGNVGFSSPGGKLDNVANSLLSSPFLSTQEGLVQLLGHSIDQGWFPCPPRENEASVELTWIKPAIDEPEPSRITYVDDRQGQLVRITARDHQATVHFELRQGATLTAPTWPELPSISKERFDGSDVLRLWGGGMSLLGRLSEELENKEK